MKMKMKKIAAVVLSFVMILAFSACSKGSGGGVLATVGGTKISENQVKSYSSLVAVMSGASYDELDDSTKAYLDNSILLWLTDQACTKEHFETEGKTIITDEIKEELDANAQRMLDSLTQQVGEEQIKAAGVDKALLTGYLEAQYYDDAFRQEVIDENPVTDADAEAYYEENKEAYSRVSKSVASSHILIGDGSHSAEDLALAKDVLAKAKAGEDFAALALEYSADTGSAANGGSIGEYDENGNLSQAYKDAMLDLDEGEISGIVESELGYHIIKATKVNAAGQMSFDEVKEQIITQLEQQRVADAYPILREEIGIKWNDSLTINPDTKLPEPQLPEAGSEDSE
jgi:hypothetical protein